jgi:hypothetical protein
MSYVLKTNHIIYKVFHENITNYDTEDNDELNIMEEHSFINWLPPVAATVCPWSLILTTPSV